MEDRKKGLITAIGSYVLWGFLIIYWKQLEGVPAYEILAHRVVWSFFFMIIVLAVLGMMGDFRSLARELLQDKKRGLLLVFASFIITSNWCTFIWAVTHDHILDSSFGYYINPLVSVCMGVLFFHEKLISLKWIALFIALGGILWMGFSLGHMPWVALWLALSFAAYGAAKKKLHINPFASITLETLLTMPFALAYLLFVEIGGTGHLLAGNMTYTLFLLGAGAATAIPLILYTAGANNLPLNLLGFLQYINPTMGLFIGIFLYGEPFDENRFLGFASIWLALILFTTGDFLEMRRTNRKA